jgi:hypothetical protein
MEEREASAPRQEVSMGTKRKQKRKKMRKHKLKKLRRKMKHRR